MRRAWLPYSGHAQCVLVGGCPGQRCGGWLWDSWAWVCASGYARNGCVCMCANARVCVCDWHGVVLFANLKQLGMLKAACVRHALLHDRGAAVRVCPCGVVWWPSAPAEFKHIGRQRNCNKHGI